jgi:hypothetical protein
LTKSEKWDTLEIDMLFSVALELDYTLPHLTEALSGIQNLDSLVEEAFFFASSCWRGRQLVRLANCR